MLGDTAGSIVTFDLADGMGDAPGGRTCWGEGAEVAADVCLRLAAPLGWGEATTPGLGFSTPVDVIIGKLSHISHKLTHFPFTLSPLEGRCHSYMWLFWRMHIEIFFFVSEGYITHLVTNCPDTRARSHSRVL